MSVGFDPRTPHHWIAFGLGSGLVPIAPGTFGTLAAVPVYLLLAPLPVWAYVVVTALFFALGVWACGRAALDLGRDDPSALVWDEWVGFLVTMTAAPSGWAWILAGFLLFRLLDIAKPWPVGWLDQRVGGGLGIMLDDLAAGAMAWAALRLSDLWLV